MSLSRYERTGLETALCTLNRARRETPGSRARLEGCLRGLEELLDAEPSAAGRERDGGRALAELDRLLKEPGGDADTRAVCELLDPIVDKLVGALLGYPEHRLASYGSLRPGETNHHEVSSLVGRWFDATVRGRFYADGGAATGGFPGFVRDHEAEAVDLQVFESAALVGHWERLDRFEGPGYRRVLITVEGEDGLGIANIYEVVSAPA